MLLSQTKGSIYLILLIAKYLQCPQKGTYLKIYFAIFKWFVLFLRQGFICPSGLQTPHEPKEP